MTAKKPEPTFVSMTKEDATDASWRVAASTTTNLAKRTIAKTLKSQGVKNSSIKAFTEILSSDFGEVLLSLGIGYGLTYGPKVSDNEKAQRLAKEFRVQGMVAAGDGLQEMAMETFLPTIMEVIGSFPEQEEPQVRIKTEDSSSKHF